MRTRGQSSTPSSLDRRFRFDQLSSIPPSNDPCFMYCVLLCSVTPSELLFEEYRQQHSIYCSRNFSLHLRQHLIDIIEVRLVKTVFGNYSYSTLTWEDINAMFSDHNQAYHPSETMREMCPVFCIQLWEQGWEVTPIGDTTKPGQWTLDWTLDWTLHWNMDQVSHST